MLGILRLLLFAMSAILLLFSMWNWLTPRPHYLRSKPKAGQMVNEAPAAVTIEFSEGLTSSSTASVASTITLSPNGERVYSDGKRFTTTGPSLAHNRRTLHIPLDPALPKGLYWVQWNVASASSNAPRFGKFCFVVGMSVPDDIIRDLPGGIMERDDRYRYHRAAFLSGILLFVIGLILTLGVAKRDHLDYKI